MLKILGILRFRVVRFCCFESFRIRVQRDYSWEGCRVQCLGFVDFRVLDFKVCSIGAGFEC